MKNILFCLPLLAVSPVFAEPTDDETQTEKLPVIVINSGRLQSPEQLIPGDYQIIDRKQIERSGAANVTDVLRSASGLQITDQFGDASRATVSMRGFGENTFGNTLILVDGRRLNNSLDIAAPTLSSINVDDIERVEILHGSGGVLFGENAVGGVINIVTRARTATYLNLNVSHGSYDTEGYRADAGVAVTDDLQLSASGETRNSDNYRQNNQLERDSHRLRVDWRPNRNHLFAEFSRTNEDLRTPGAIFLAEAQQNRRQPNNFNDFQHSDIDSLNAGARMEFPENWRFEVDYDWRDDDVGGFLTVGGFGSAFTQVRRQWSWRPRLLHRFSVLDQPASVLFGADYERGRYEINSALGTQTAAQRSLGKYVLATIRPVQKVELVAGIRHVEVDTDLQDNFTFTNGIDIDNSAWLHEYGMRFFATDSLELYLRRADSFRFGKVDEHTNQAFGTTTALAPQTGSSWESGLVFRADRDELQLSLYRMRLRNEIAFDPTIFANRNLDPTRRIGAQLRWTHQINDQWHFSLGHEQLDARFAGGTNEDEFIPFVARHSSNAQLGWHGANGHSGVLEFQRIGDRAPTGDDQGAFDDVNGHELVHAGWRWDYRAVSLGLRVNNLLNEQYDAFGTLAFNPFPNQETAFMPAPERNFMLKLEYRLGDH